MKEYTVRPTTGNWGVFEFIDVDRAKKVFEGTYEECLIFISEAQENN